MTTTQILGPYECHNAYRGLHFDPFGVEWSQFLADGNDHPKTGDGAAPAALPPAAAAASTPQPVPSPPGHTGGVG